jgi:hypothetical protein
MGYYSSFEVIDSNVENIEEFLNANLEDTGSPFWETYNDAVRSSDSTKWYYWLEDLANLVEDYPGLYLVIERTGEESPDISRVIVRDGSVTEIFPEIVWPEV